ncbi:uncharacterized WD repeat-containing protein alr3466-like [Diabrotica virgifera virgifera]|uniref:Uncharacterized protein n=1 Tax=Diabrotica virgifera virgifera TaxID=50390 RepID=A0ABM5KY60_DIAVI|nr:uncharacterized WD repeat-containing protein alr3466-like [Diabrotica virgifera virgifera]
MKFHPNLPNILGLAFGNGIVTLKDIQTGENMISLEKHSAPITGINFTANQKTVITTGLDKKICIYDFVSGECVFCMNIHQSVTSSDISLDDICIAAGLDDRCISLYDISSGGSSILKKLGELDSPIRTVDFNSVDEQLAISPDKSLNLFTDRDSENNFVKTANYSEKCSYMKFHPNLPNILGLAFGNGIVTLKDIQTGENMISLEKHSAPITGINFTANQKTVITTGLDKKICIYDFVSGECVFCMNIHQSVTSSDISLDDICIAAGLDDGCISLYDIRDPLKPFMYTNAHNCPVNKVSFEKSPVFIEHLRDRNSETTLMDSDFGDQSYAVQDLYEAENDPEEKFKQDIMKMIKTNMDNLQAQLNEHCTKFQNFMISEFDSIQNAMNRWDVFNMGDNTEIVQALNSVGSKSVKIAYSKKSNGNS